MTAGNTVRLSSRAEVRGPRRRIRYGLARAAVAVVTVTCIAAATGAAFQAFASEADRRVLPAPGQLVDVGGYQLHLNWLGSGGATVILESALPAGSSVWGWVQAGLADRTRVCAYDRAGEGWSDLGPEPRDATRVARELHVLLTNAGVRGPFVLVGHSFGGLYTRVFASLYPDEVVGMVLIDASHPDQWTRTSDGPAIQRSNQLSAAVGPWMARLGVLRLSTYIKIDADLPTQRQGELRASMNGTHVWESYAAVFRAVGQTMAQARASGALGSMPLALLTATDHGFPPPMEQLHQGLQTELVGLSSNSRQQVVEGATHVSLVNNREQAQITVERIDEILKLSATYVR